MKKYVKLRNEEIPFDAFSFTVTKKEVKLLTPEALKITTVNEALKPGGILIPATEKEFVAAGGKI